MKQKKDFIENLNDMLDGIEKGMSLQKTLPLKNSLISALINEKNNK